MQKKNRNPRRDKIILFDGFWIQSFAFNDIGINIISDLTAYVIYKTNEYN